MIRQPFRFEDYERLGVQPWQAHENLTAELAAVAAASGPSWAYFDGAAQCRAVGGLVPGRDGAWAAWSYVDAKIGRAMPGLVRHMIRVLKDADRPVEAFCAEGFEAGARLLSMLGFRDMGLMPVRGSLSYRVFRYEVANVRA